MKPTVDWKREEPIPLRVVVVEPSRYAELLISRRKLERLWNRPTRLLDLETHEVFVNQIESDARLAEGA